MVEQLYINRASLHQYQHFVFYFLSKYQDFSWRIFRLIPFLVFIFFIRPTGIVTVITFTIYLLYLVGRNVSKKQFAYYLVLPLIVVFLILANKMLSYYNIIEALQNGQIICGLNDIKTHIADTEKYSHYQSNLLKIVLFIWDNPVHFIKISFYKMSYFLSTCRPTYSYEHNFVSIVFFLPVYAFAILAGFKSKIKLIYKIYILSFIGLIFALVLVTYINWDSRFLTPILPFIFILSATGSDTFYRLYLEK